LSIFPEGATTNGKYLLKFKKGAFAGFIPVKPIANFYDAPRISSAYGIHDIFLYIFVHCMNPYVTLRIREYPVFEPNDYFFEHHWDEKSGEEKWEAYARVIREIIANSFNFKLSELSMEDKKKYKEEMKAALKNPKISSEKHKIL
jgi:hypothetical protein